MTRKAATLLTVILLLLAGGGVAFYFHLRKQTLPGFSEVDQYLHDEFLHDLPAASRWALNDYREETVPVSVVSKGLARFFERSDKKLQTNHYTFIDRSGKTIYASIVRDQQQIRSIFLSSSVSSGEDFKRVLLVKFSHRLLARRIQVF